MSDAPHVLTERDGHVLVVTLNRPEARNAFSPEMLVRLWDAWQEVDADPEIRAVVLTGAGGTFCAGADLKAMSRGFGGDDPWQERFKQDPDLQWKAMLRHHRASKPIVAAVEGYCIAGGMEILQATEIRVAAESAKLGLAEVRWSLFPIGGSTVRLRRQIPYTHAAELLLTGQPISARRAAEIGLIGHVVPDGQALERALELAHTVARNGPVAVQTVLRSMRETEGLPEDEALKIELRLGLPVFATEDAREGPRAFAEKRTPEFKGR